MRARVFAPVLATVVMAALFAQGEQPMLCKRTDSKTAGATVALQLPASRIDIQTARLADKARQRPPHNRLETRHALGRAGVS